MLASCSSDSHIKIWRYEEKQLIECAKVKAHLKGVREVQWKPNYLVDSERIIISCSEVL